MQAFLIFELSLGHVRISVYFTVYLMCVVSKFLGLSQDQNSLQLLGAVPLEV